MRGRIIESLLQLQSLMLLSKNQRKYRVVHRNYYCPQ